MSDEELERFDTLMTLTKEELVKLIMELDHINKQQNLL
jgi:succinate dehydrogenase flavin-adding protein (antitoxin of CptAB toxin-antitoxin module)